MTPNFELPSDVRVRDDKQFRQKLAHFPGSSDIIIHIDFASLLADSDRVPLLCNDGLAGWNILANTLPEDGQKEYYARYPRLCLRDSLDSRTPPREAINWKSAILRIFAKYHLDINEAEKEFLTQNSLRSGTEELFSTCRAHSIPTLVSSILPENIIKSMLGRNIRPTVIQATKPCLDDQRRVQSWRINTRSSSFSRVEGRKPRNYPGIIALGNIGLRDAENTMRIHPCPSSPYN